MIDAMRTIDGWAAAWAPLMLRACWQGGLALLAAYVLTRLVRRLPPAAKTWAWRIAYLKLIVALQLMTPVTLQVLHQRIGPSISGSTQTIAGPLPLDHGSIEGSRPILRAAVSALAVSPSAAAIADAGQRLWSWCAVLFAVWSVGTAFTFLRMGIKWRDARRLIASCHPMVDPLVIRRYTRIAHDMGLHHPPELLCGRDVGPLLIGVFRPAVVIPNVLDSNLPLVLAHELAHFRRRDTLWALLPAAARVLFWFHPMIWLAEQEWHVCTESACDQACLSATGAAPASYGRMLLDLTLAAGSGPAPLLAVGAARSRHAIERRLRAMRHFTDWSRRRWRVAAAVVFVASVVALVPWRLAAQPLEGAKDERAKLHDSNHPATQPATIEERIAAMPADQREALQGQIDLRLAHTAPVSRAKVRAAVVFDVFMNSRIKGHAQIDCDGVRLDSPVVGVLRQVKFKEGDRVKKGDVLFEFDDAKARAAIIEAQARVKLAEFEFKRDMDVHESINEAQIEKARAARDVAEAELNIAAHDLAETRILSPLPGVVDGVSVVSGEPVKVGDYLIAISDIDSLRVRAQVPADTPLHAGQHLDVYVPSINRPFSARVTFIASHVEGNQLEIKATIENRDGLLKPGMEAWVDLGAEE